MWVLLSDKLVPGIDLDLCILLTVSVLLFLEVSTVSLDVCDFYVLSTVSILFFDEIGDMLASLTKFTFISLLCKLCQYFVFGVLDTKYLSFKCLF